MIYKIINELNVKVMIYKIINELNVKVIYIIINHL